MLYVSKKKFTQEELENINIDIFIKKFLEDNIILFQTPDSIIDLAHKNTKEIDIRNGSVILYGLVYKKPRIEPDTRNVVGIWV